MFAERCDFKFFHTFDVDGREKKILIKCKKVDCWPGGRVINHYDIADKLGRETTSKENAEVCREMHRRSYDYVH